MKTIKINKHKQVITLDGVKYKGYTVGNLPKSFGFIGEDNEGHSEWFKFNSLTYIKIKESIWN